MKYCPLCGGDGGVDTEPEVSTTLPFNCMRCGTFSATRQAIRDINQVEKPRLSIYTRRARESGYVPEVLKTKTLDLLANTYRDTGVLQKLDYFLQFLQSPPLYLNCRASGIP